jgi:hypothetical protein
MSPGPRDWQDDARRIGMFTAPVLVNPQPGQTATVHAAGEGPPETLEELERRHQYESRKAELDDERDAERRSRKIKRDAEDARNLAAIRALQDRPDGEGSASSMALFREILGQNQQAMNALQGDLRQARADAQTSASQATQAGLAALEQRIAGLQNAGAPAGAGTVNALEELVKTATAITQVRTALDNAIPHAPALNPGLSREQALEEQRIQAEVTLRNRNLDLQLAEADAAREAAREDREMSRRRIDSVLGTVDRAAGPLLAAIVGDRFGGAANGSAPPPPPPDAGYTPAPMAASGPPLPAQLPYTCPYCNGVNYEPPGTASTTCPRCGQFVMLTMDGP